MASNFTPKAAANAIGCSTDTIRRYCALYGRHLSDGATPAKGKPRILTAEDVFVIKQAKDKTEEGATIEEVDSFLDTIVFTEEAGVEVVEVVETEDFQVAQAQGSGEAIDLLRRMTTAIEAIEAKEDRFARLEAQIDEVRQEAQAQPEAEAREGWVVARYPEALFLTGIVAIVLIVVAFALGVWLGG